MTTSSEPNTRNNLATFSVIIGILAFLALFFVPGGAVVLGLVAVILGGLALREIKANGSQGRGLAITGIVLGVVGVAVFFVNIFILGPIIANTFNSINASLNGV